MTRRRSKNTFFSLAIAGLSTWAIAAHAAGIDADGNHLRINLSKELGALGQQVSSASCRVAAGMDPEYAQNELRTAHVAFEAILDALENGNRTLGLPDGETGEDVLAALATLRGVWNPIGAISKDIAEGNHTQIGEVADANKDLLAASRSVASAISKQYADATTQNLGAAQTLNMAGRQPLISYTISMNICGLATQQPAFGTSDALRETVSLYSVSLDALTTGMDVLGVQPPPTEEIAEELSELAEDWSNVEPLLNDLASGTDVSAQDVIQFAYVKDAHAASMNKLVSLYSQEFGVAGQVHKSALDSYVRVNLAVSASN